MVHMGAADRLPRMVMERVYLEKGRRLFWEK